MKKIKTVFMVILGITALIRSAAAATCTLEGQTVGDQAGRKVTVTQPFTRIISLYGAHTENLFGLGLDTEIVGVSRGEHYPPQAQQKTIYSYHDDAEKFLGARPDLVLIRPMIDRGYPALVQRLEQSGITVLSLQPGSIDEMFVYWQILGVLTENRRRPVTWCRRLNRPCARLIKKPGPSILKKRCILNRFTTK